MLGLLAAISFLSNKMATLSEAAAREISSLCASDGKKRLAQCLAVDKDLSEDVDARNFFRIEHLHNVLLFAAEKGFPWSHVCQTLDFCDDLLVNTANKSLVIAIERFQNHSTKLIPLLGDRNYKLLRDFILTTYLSHYKLYHYVYTTHRDTYVPSATLHIEIPNETFSIKDAKTERIWKYCVAQDGISDLEKEELDQFTSQNIKDVDASVQDTAKVVHESDQGISPQTATKQELESLIESLCRGVCDDLLKNVTVNLNHSHQKIGYKLQKTAMPRPTELGPPERFTVRPTSAKRGLVQADKNKRKSVKSSSLKLSAKSKK